MEAASLEYVRRWESRGDAVAVAGGGWNLDKRCFPHVEGGSQRGAREHFVGLQDWLPAYIEPDLPWMGVVLGGIDGGKKELMITPTL